MTDQIKEVLKMDDKVVAMAKELYQQKSLLIMGRGYNFATCLEGALVRIDAKFFKKLRYFLFNLKYNTGDDLYFKGQLFYGN